MIFHDFFTERNIRKQSLIYIKDMLNQNKIKIVKNSVLIFLNYESEQDYFKLAEIFGDINFQVIQKFKKEIIGRIDEMP